MNRNEDKPGFDSVYIRELGESYERTADELTERRNKLLAYRTENKLPPEELRSVGVRIDTLYAEISDLRRTALHLRRLAAPPSPSPSLARRGRSAS